MKIKELLKLKDIKGENIGKIIVKDLRTSEITHHFATRSCVEQKRITKEQIEQLLEEEVDYEFDGDRWYCWFEDKSREEICDQLGIQYSEEVYHF